MYTIKLLYHYLHIFTKMFEPIFVKKLATCLHKVFVQIVTSKFKLLSL